MGRGGGGERTNRHRTDAPFLLQSGHELVRRRLRVGDTGTDLDCERDLAKDLRHADERLSELSSVSEESGSGALVEDEVDRAAAVDVCEG